MAYFLNSDETPRPIKVFAVAQRLPKPKMAVFCVFLRFLMVFAKSSPQKMQNLLCHPLFKSNEWRKLMCGPCVNKDHKGQ